MPEPHNPSSDYISVLSIKTFFLNLFSVFLTFLLFISNSIRRYFLLIILLSVSGVAVGYAYYAYAPTYYKTQMIVQHNELTKKTYYEIIHNLNSLIGSESYPKLANELKIAESAARKIGFLEVVGINGESLVKDTSTQTRQVFTIIAQLSDNSVIDTLQKAIVKYLNNNPFTYKLKEGKKKVYLEKLNFIDKEMERLDTLKENYNRFLLTSKISATYYNNSFDPADIYRQSSNLANQKEVILDWLNIEDEAISVIDGFKTPANPQSGKLRETLLAGLLSGFILSFFIALFLSMKKLV